MSWLAMGLWLVGNCLLVLIGHLLVRGQLGQIRRELKDLQKQSIRRSHRLESMETDLLNLTDGEEEDEEADGETIDQPRVCMARMVEDGLALNTSVGLFCTDRQCKHCETKALQQDTPKNHDRPDCTD